MLQEGERAPDFCLEGVDEKGDMKEFCLSDLLKAGKNIVLYFYPKDNTPGCTSEACDFRDNFSRIGDRATVIGVSPDSVQSHKKFQEKHGLNYPLLSDPEHGVLESCGAWGEKKMYGKVMVGVIRSTCIIGADGVTKKKWVKVKGHVDRVIEELEKLSG